MKASRDAALGVFDSGVGGLTVARALRSALPNEPIVYLGDTARVPYGTRGAATVIRYAIGCARKLAQYEIKAIVIACNTASAVALPSVMAELDLPTIGVIEPGAEVASETTRSGRIGVLATSGTVASGAYQRAIANLDTRAEVTSVAAPLLVPLAEEGWTEGDVPRQVVERYLEPLARANVDTIVLGCTHYPLLSEVITAAARQAIGDHVRIVDGARAAANATRTLLDERSLARQNPVKGPDVRILVTDRPASFEVVAERFLGSPPGPIEVVDL